MADFSYVQGNFFGGRWSKNMQGRMDMPQYKTALAEMFNALPSEEGAFIRRSGWESIGDTKDGSLARLIPFKFSSTAPYIAEFTDAYLRLWTATSAEINTYASYNNVPPPAIVAADEQLVLASDNFVLIESATNAHPTVFSCQAQSRDGVRSNLPVTIYEGDYLLVMNSLLTGTGTYGMLAGPKVWQATNVAYTGRTTSPNFTCNLTDPVTGDAISVGTAATFYTMGFKVLVLASPYAASQIAQIRKVQSAGDKAGQYASGPIEQVTFLHPAVQPQALLTTQPFSQGLSPVKFTDGPYLDQPDTQIPLQPGGTTGVINIAVIGWLASTTYALGDAVAYNDALYVSLIDNNLGNTPPSIIDANWVLAPVEWDSGTTYSIGQAALFGGVVYFSNTSSNSGNEPDIDATDWASAVPADYAAGTTYAENSYVSYSAATYLSLVNSNVGNTPDSSPTDWLAFDIVTYSTEVQELLTGFVFSAGDIGRHIRLQAAPPPYVSTQTYAQGALVTYNGNIYSSLINSNTNNEPDITPTDWQLQATLPAWTWGIITGGGGQVLITSIPAWDTTTNYAQYSLVTYNGYVYFADNKAGGGNGSNVDKQPLDFDYTRSQPSDTLWWIGLSAVVSGGLPANPWAPQTYQYLDVVTYSGSTWVCVHTSVGPLAVPGVSPFWHALSGGAKTVDQSPYSVTVSIQGPNLPNTNPIYSWRLGVYCDATGWPACGTYHEGRLWLNGPVPNRFDASTSNDPFNFAPTDYSGNVSDANAISETLNSDTSEAINAFSSSTNGLTIYTAGGEWLVSASRLDDPITPTSIQARKVSAWGSYNQETIRLPTAQGVIHGLQKKVLEHKVFIDTSSYSQLYSANDMTHVAKDLSAPGVVELAWQQEPEQNIWCRCADGSFFGIGYKREPELIYCAPHEHAHGNDDSLVSFCTQLDATGIGENLYGCFGATVDGVTAYSVQKLHSEWLPTDSPSDAMMLDGAAQAQGVAMPASSYADVTTWKLKFFGLQKWAGQTVTLVIGGVPWGAVSVAADGTAILSVLPNFTWDQTTNTVTGDGPLNPYALIQAFNWQDVLQVSSLEEYLANNSAPFPATPAAPQNYAQLMLGVWAIIAQEFDSSDTGFTYNVSFANAANWVYCSEYLIVGYFENTEFVTCNAFAGKPYLSQGQMLRPIEGGQNGPAFAKTRRNARAALFVSYANEVSIGTNFADLHALPLTLPDGVTTPAATDLVTGIFRDSVDDDYNFDGMLCWQFTACYPGAVLAAGGFSEVIDL